MTNIENIEDNTRLALQVWRENWHMKGWETVINFTDETTVQAFQRFEEFKKELPKQKFRLIRADIIVNITVLRQTDYEEL